MGKRYDYIWGRWNSGVKIEKYKVVRVKYALA